MQPRDAELPSAANETVDRHILSFFAQLVQDLGGDPDGLLESVGIDPDAFDAGRHKPTYRETVELVGLAATRLSCLDFGMRLATRQAGHIHSPLVALMQSCKTVGDAIRQASDRSYAHSPAAAIWFETSDVDEQFLVGHDILLDGLPNRAQMMEHILLIARFSIADISGGRARPRKVHFRHQRISSLDTYRNYFGCEVAFGQRDDALVFDERLLACPTVNHDEDALRAAIGQIETDLFARAFFRTSVRGAVLHRLGTADCNAPNVADSLRLHRRAMHRRLAAEGTSFQRIKNEVRRDLALFLLENTSLQLSSISERLGFAEQSTFSHFCRKWLQNAPSELRARALRSPESALSKTNKSGGPGPAIVLSSGPSRAAVGEMSHEEHATWRSAEPGHAYAG